MDEWGRGPGLTSVFGHERLDDGVAGHVGARAACAAAAADRRLVLARACDAVRLLLLLLLRRGKGGRLVALRRRWAQVDLLQAADGGWCTSRGSHGRRDGGSRGAAGMRVSEAAGGRGVALGAEQGEARVYVSGP